jgi:ferric-dicitrate binding protein FerR (iron transport regulator)
MTIEELLLDQSFIDYCVNTNSSHKLKWDEIRAVDPEQALLMNEAKEILTVISPVLSDTEIATEVNRFKELFTENTPVIELPKTKTRRTGWYIASAAACAIIVSLIFLFRPAEKPILLAITEHKTGFGERKQILLPDGSTAILNSNSRLTYKSDYNTNERHLELSGEAFFEVAHDPNKKFIVNTYNFSSTAVGTAFYIHGRNPNSYSVDLIEGKLNVQNASKKPVMLQAGTAASWVNSGFTVNSFDSTSLRHWINGKLSFQHVATNDVLSQLAKWYAVAIEDRRKKPGSISITGDYSNKPLTDILKAISFSMNCQYTITESTIIIQ